MPRDILLDTSPVIAHLRRRADVREAAPEGALLFVSLYTVGELEKGIARAQDPQGEREKVETFLAQVALIMPDTATAKIYGQVSADLEKRGQKIPENDVWIAATALECDMALATRDAHFERVAGLEVLRW